MNEKQRCGYCNTALQETLTTFTVAKAHVVYVVRDVPTLECPHCGHVSYRQDVAKRLERFAAGRVTPRQKPLTAWVYCWDDALVEVPEGLVPSETKNYSLIEPATSGQLVVSSSRT